MEFKKDKEKEVYDLLMAGKYTFEGNKSPSFQLYVNEFLIGTISMTPGEIGSYILLLLHQWDLFSLPNDKEELAELGRCPEVVITKLVKKFKVCTDGKIRNSKLEKIRAIQIIGRDIKSKSGSLGAESRYGKKGLDSAKQYDDLKKTLEPIPVGPGLPDFFYIGTQAHKGAVSEYMKENMQIFLESWQMKNPGQKKEAIFITMDQQNVGHQYTDAAHIQNAFKKTAKEMNKPVYTKGAPQQTQTAIKASVLKSFPKE